MVSLFHFDYLKKHWIEPIDYSLILYFSYSPNSTWKSTFYSTENQTLNTKCTYNVHHNISLFNITLSLSLCRVSHSWWCFREVLWVSNWREVPLLLSFMLCILYIYIHPIFILFIFCCSFFLSFFLFLGCNWCTTSTYIKKIRSFYMRLDAISAYGCKLRAR